MRRIAITVLVLALTAGTASAQTAGITFGPSISNASVGGEFLGFDLTTSESEVRFDTLSGHVDRPIFGPLTVAGGGLFSLGSDDSHSFHVGAGPGVRFPVGDTDLFGHYLFGTQSVLLGDFRHSVYGERIGFGLDIPIGAYSLRAAYDVYGYQADVMFGFASIEAKLWIHAAHAGLAIGW